MNLKVNPYATAIEEHQIKKSSISLQDNINDMFTYGQSALGEDGSYDDTIYMSESFRIAWSDINILMLRSSTGFLNGLFDNQNSTLCGSRSI